MLVRKLKQLASDRGIDFKIGEEHWQNLIDAADDVDLPFEDKQVYMLLFNEKESRTYGDYSPNQEKYTAIFLLAVRSRIYDPSFEFKYDNHIEPLKQLARSIEEEDFQVCDDLQLNAYSIEGWRENYLDTNLDCVEVHITVERI